MRRITITLFALLTLAACSSATPTAETVDAVETTTTTAAPTTTATLPAHEPTPEDFSIEVVELRRACFGSAGCNVTYTIEPTYIGPDAPPALKTYTVIYEIGGAQSTTTGNFTMTNLRATTRGEETVSTAADVPLTATVTRVLQR